MCMDGQPEGWGRNFVGEPFEEIHGTLCGSNYGSIATDIARWVYKEILLQAQKCKIFGFLVEKEKGALSMDELRAKDGIYYAIASSTMALTGTFTCEKSYDWLILYIDQGFGFTAFFRNQLVADVKNPDSR